jgi:hypothetical protein
MLFKLVHGKTWQQALGDTGREALQEFREKLDAALKIADPADKMLALSDVVEDVRKTSDYGEKIVRKHARGLEIPPGVAMFFGMAVPMFVGMMVGFPVLGYLLSFVGAGLGVWAGEDILGKREERALANFKGIFDGMKDVIATSQKAGADILSNQLSALAQSPKLEELHKRIPSLRDRFAKAFETQQPPSAPPPNAAPNKLHL